MHSYTWFSALYLTLSVVLFISTFVDSSVLPFKNNFLLASLFALSRTEDKFLEFGTLSIKLDEFHAFWSDCLSSL